MAGDKCGKMEIELAGKEKRREVEGCVDCLQNNTDNRIFKVINAMVCLKQIGPLKSRSVYGYPAILGKVWRHNESCKW